MPDKVLTTATVTGKAGPGQTLTAQAFTNLSGFRVDVAKGILVLEGGDTYPQPKEIDVSAATTFTVTITSGNYAITVS